MLDAEDKTAICLNCGHSESDHSVENETCWHSTAHNGKVELCNCSGWQQSMTAGAAD